MEKPRCYRCGGYYAAQTGRYVATLGRAGKPVRKFMCMKCYERKWPAKAPEVMHG
jgi:hypothetical protein